MSERLHNSGRAGDVGYVISQAAAGHQALAVESDAPGSATVASAGYWGFVESLNADSGLSGWVICATPSDAPTVALYVGETEVARTRPSVSRPDIWVGNQLDYVSGFSFELEQLLPLLARTDLSMAEIVHVRVVGTSCELQRANDWSLGELITLMRAHEAVMVGDESIANLPLHMALDRLLRRSYPLLSRPRRTDQTSRVGLIEFLCYLPDGGFIVGGWWSSEQPRHNSAVILANSRKYAAALSFMDVPREDLDAGSVGFIGMLCVAGELDFTDAHPQFTLCLGESQQSWISTMRATRAVSPSVALTELQRQAMYHGSPQALALLALATAASPWARSSQSAEQSAIRVGIDALQFAPGFGVIVRGWILAPMGQLTDVAARSGSGTYLLDPDTLCFNPRADLAGAFSGLSDRTSRAGFCCVLRGHGAPEVSRPSLLRLHFNSGASIIHEVSVEQTRVIDNDFDLTALCDDRIGLHSAPWSPDFIESVFAAKRLPQPPQTHNGRLSQGGAVLLRCLPAQVDRQRMMLDAIEREAPQLELAGVALLLLLPQTLSRGMLHSWLAHIKRELPQLTLLSCTPVADANPWQVLPALLVSLPFERFAFLGPDVIVTAKGIGALVDRIAQVCPERPFFLPIASLRGGVHKQQSWESQAFGWGVSEFVSFQEFAPALIGGCFERNGIELFASCEEVASEGEPMAYRVSAITSGGSINSINRRMLALAAKRRHIMASPQTIALEFAAAESAS